MSDVRFWRKLAQHVVSLPSVGIPLALGTVTTGTSWMVGQGDGFLGFLGVTGILFGIGLGATKLILGFDELARSVLRELRSDQKKENNARLKDLQNELRKDQDQRTSQFVKQLRKLFLRMDKAGFFDNTEDSADLLGISDRAKELYESSIASLRRSLLLWETANEMSTQKGREDVLEIRETLLDEVGESLSHLGATLDRLKTSELRRETTINLAQIRDELEQGLEVARRVEERLAGMGQTEAGQALQRLDR